MASGFARSALLGLLALASIPCFGARPYQPVRADPLSESWRWRTFPELSGLDAQCMTAAANGTIWFGLSDGAASYDGFEWKRHLEGGALGGTVNTLCAQSDGTLFAGGWWGIGQFSGGQWTRLIPALGKRFADVRRLAIAPDGSLWAATSWGALRRQQSTWTLYTDAATATRLRADPNQQSLRIELFPEAVLARSRSGSLIANRSDLSEVCADRQGRIWFGTRAGEVLCHTPATSAAQAAWTLYNESDGVVAGRIPAIMQMQDDTIWVVPAPSEQASVFDGQAWRTIALPTPGVAPDGARLLQTRDGVIWLSVRYVLFAYRDGRWQTYEKPAVPIPTANNLLAQSADGVLWIAGPNTDIQRVDYQTPRWSTLLDLNFQWESPAGAQWFLHRDDRVVVHEANRWTSYGVEDGLIDAPVALLGTRDGAVWAIGSHENTAATARLVDQKWTRTIHAEFSSAIDWRAAFESSDGSMWLGAFVDSSGPPQYRDGILQFRDGVWTHHHQPGRAPSGAGDDNPVTLLLASRRPEPIEKYSSFGESRDGRIWAGRNVLVFHDGKKWEELMPTSEVRVGIIEASFTTRERDLWIGTRQYGALRYDGRRWQQFQDKDSLVANSVRSFAQSADGSIWVATDRGISRFDGQTWTADVLPEPLSIPHESGGLKTSSAGTLWINRHTVNWNRRGWPRSPPPAPDAEFWTVCHQFQGTPPQTTIVAGSEKISQPGNLSVLWSGAVPWREPKDARLQYSYRLDDEPWSPYTSDQGHAFFTLPSGAHRFEVRARDQDFNVDLTPATLSFTVLPPVWRQAWFIVLMALLTGSTLAQSVRVFLERARLRRTNRELAGEMEARERTEIALRSVLRHARTFVVHNLVTAPEGWEPSAPGWSLGDFRWERTFPDEDAAREVLPLDVPSGGTYEDAWERAKHREDHAPMTQVATRAFASGASSWRQEFRCLDRHGKVHWFTQAASIEKLRHGQWRVTTINTDITERVLAEDALRASEERLSTVFHLSPTPICIVRMADNRFVDANEAFIQGTGYTREEIIGQTPTGLGMWEDPAERAAIMAELQKKSAVVAFKLRGRRKSGEVGVGLSSLTRIALNGEEHLLWLIQDITEFEHAEEARRESERRFRQVTENIDEVFWLTDTSKNDMIYVSPAYQSVWGRTCDSLYTAPQLWLEAVHAEDRERVRAALGSQATGGYNIEYRVVRPDGTVRWVHDRAFPIKDANGRVYRVAGVAEDITAKHQLEDQLRQAQKMESLGTLAGGIAHDFNNILTGVLGSAEIARLKLPATDPSQPWIANILTAGARAKDLVQQILTFGRKHESKMAPRKIQRDVGEALRLLRSSIPSTVRIDSRLDPACPPVIADDTQIHQVVMNLCTNAWHAVPASGGVIEVTLAPTHVSPEMAATRLGLKAGPHVLLTIRDNGCGMSADIVARIFEPFFTTKEKGQGTGLGLAVVHGIVQSHHGAIFVHSTPGAGTRFEVFLPAIAEPAAPAPVAKEPIVTGHQERILVVDDDGIALAAVRGQLEHIGYRVMAVSDPRVALKLFTAQPSAFDLVLTDNAMPGLSGRELSEKILAIRPDIPVLLASGVFDAKHLDEARAIGIREFVRKPAPLPELAKIVARHVRAAPHR